MKHNKTFFNEKKRTIIAIPKMNKKIILILTSALFFLIIFQAVLVFATSVCCEKTIKGAWCQFEDSSQCEPKFSQAPTSCEQTSFCQKGTCVNEQSGTCSPNTPKSPCEKQGGKWYNKPKEEISVCKLGCCVLGQEVAFVNQNECKQLASDYGINTSFREDINSQSECFSLDTTTDEGACVFKKEQSTKCIRTTKSVCTNTYSGNFNKGLLCTAPDLSDCAKTEKTTCDNDGKIYFLDSCGNKANIYDEKMYLKTDAGWTKEMTDYWTEIKEPVCTVGSAKSSSCGDCSYRLGTTCTKYKSTNDPGMPGAPKFGENVCRELSCYYDTNNDKSINPVTEKYFHGESWCAETSGTYFHVPVNLDEKTINQLIEKGDSDYNLPGSKYYKLKCYDGEVIVEPCKEFRNSICKESSVTGFREAACIGNAAVLCPGITNKTNCEAEEDCKWIPGYMRRDKGRLLDATEEEFEEQQGACYPLFSPGLKFWEVNAEQLCASNMIQERAFYETPLTKEREKFAGESYENHAEKCLDNCYAIPEYGSGNTEEQLKEFQLGTGSADSTSHLSKREGYYCKKDADKPDSIDNTKTGGERGSDIDCSARISTEGKGSSADLDRRRKKLFYTHEEWIKRISERTRSSGDCGYKPHAYSEITNWQGDPDSEKINAVFQKVGQKGNVKANLSVQEKLYDGPAINEGVPIEE